MMQQSCKDNLYELRLRTGAGLQECAAALKRYKGDILLAEGWLKYYGCAINTPGMTHEEWADDRAHSYKAQVQPNPIQPNPLDL